MTLSYDNGEGLVFHRQIAVDERYMFTIRDSVENKSDKPVTLAPYALVARHGLPKTVNYSVLHEGFVGVIGDGGVEEIKYDKIEKEDHAAKTLSGVGGWLGFTDKYWAAAVIPDQKEAIEARFSAGLTGPIKSYRADFVGPALVISPGASSETTSRLFAGAKEVHTLDAYQADLGIKKFELLIDWGWFYFITRPMFQLLHFLYTLTGNFGVAILIATVIVKGLFFPLASKSYLSMAKMKAVAPQIAAIRDKYPEDKMKQQQETMALYKREKINPVSGCLPMLIQIPVFFALYKVLFVTIEMRHAPFFGWIKDLSAPDPTNIFNLFGLLPFDPTQIPMIGHFLALGVWPLIMGVTMFVQMKANPEPADPTQKQIFTLDAGDLHLHPRRLSLRPRHLLGLEQHPLRRPADAHHEKSRRQNRALRQYRRNVQKKGHELMSEASGEAAADEPDFNEIGRKLFAQECDFLWAASSASQLPPPGAPGNRFRRTLQRRQILAAQRADQPQDSRAHVAHAGPHART
ncbi:membrane protein of unknown function [Methylocella tundrae]|uniref:Membrane protein insertase YidC n=1 Tax=Methylocella tundrae TaxID=227605 RepID=A0A4U8YUQ5_METTU|nr:membrane protein of unknown function [Methylocella tundrae]